MGQYYGGDTGGTRSCREEEYVPPDGMDGDTGGTIYRPLSTIVDDIIYFPRVINLID